MVLADGMSCRRNNRRARTPATQFPACFMRRKQDTMRCFCTHPSNSQKPAQGAWVWLGTPTTNDPLSRTQQKNNRPRGLAFRTRTFSHAQTLSRDQACEVPGVSSAHMMPRMSELLPRSQVRLGIDSSHVRKDHRRPATPRNVISGGREKKRQEPHVPGPWSSRSSRHRPSSTS